MFPHPGRAFLSYSRPPSAHTEQKSTNVRKQSKNLISPYLPYQTTWQLFSISEIRSPVLFAGPEALIQPPNPTLPHWIVTMS